MKRRSNTLRRRHRGLSLAEVIVSTMLIGLLMAAALASVGGAARSTTAAAEGSDALCLARQLLEEITVQPYEDSNQTPGFGLETGEVGAPGARTMCDDLDDYNDWSDSPPKDRTGTAIPGYSGWSRTADVQKVKASDKTPISDGSADEGLRLVTVTVNAPTGRTITINAFRSKTGGSLQPQGVNQTIVTWAGVTLQAGNGAAVSSGISLLNHATDE